MRKLAIAQIIFLLLIIPASYGQNHLVVNLKSPSITAKKINGSPLVIPLEAVLVNPTPASIMKTITFAVDNTAPLPESRLDAVAELPLLSIVNNNLSITAAANTSPNPATAFLLYVDAALNPANEKIFFITISDGTNTIGRVRIVLQPDDPVMTLTSYLLPANILDPVTKVESGNNTLIINGYRQVTVGGLNYHVLLKRNITLDKGEVYSVWDKKNLIQFRHFNFLESFSIFSVPYKVRPKVLTQIKGRDTTYLKSASSGLTNIGLNLELGKIQSDRYFSSGKKSMHKLSLGFFVAPTVEELDSISTKAYLKKDIKSKQLFISTAFTISYTYNDISFVFVPLGWDLQTSSVGKNWVYNSKRWWGFGIGISPKILSTILNK
jgi:hypothetical protein